MANRIFLMRLACFRDILWMMSEVISKTEQAAVSVPAIGKYMGMNNLYRNEKGNDAC